VANIINNNNINNIIIQNPEKVEVNAFLPKMDLQPRKIKTKGKKVIIKS
jgi:hypothetical protein